MIPNGAGNPDLAWEYLKYISGAEAQEYFSVMTTSVPTHIDAASPVAAHLVGQYGPDAAVFFDTMAFSRTRPLSPIANRYWAILEEYRQRAYRLEMTPIQALDEVTRILQAEM